jgi:DNA-binding response OmpR family regulator
MTGPGRPPSPPRPARPPANSGSKPPRSGRLSVLVVDDDKHWRELAAGPFRKRGDRVRTTSDGLQALAMCIEDPPDVILADVQMPRMDGWQLLRLIRARPQLAATPVVFMTSLDGDAARLKGYQLGVDAYVPKPFAAEEMLVRVIRLLRNKRMSGLDPTERVVFKGELEHVSSASLLSFLQVEKKTGVLVVVGESVVRLFLRQGRLLRAEVEGDGPRPRGREVVFRVLDWTSGQFELLEEEVEGRDEVGAQISTLLMEHARMVDEKQR